ncbi:MAG: hypothetical protein FWG39_03675 [Alphaproteobacteria bacterium]|nr:hypothetical protein [Alphaproteobacteria bacterium]
MNGLFIPDYIEIDGGRPLTRDASVNISGAKNEVLGAMAAAVLSDQPIEFANMPYISDVLDMGRIMLDLGIDVQYDPAARLMRIHAARVTSNQLPELAGKFRASYYLWGALLSRFQNTGEFNSLKIKLPGGCSFSGNRKTDYHFALIENIFGANVAQNDGGIEFSLPRGVPKQDTDPVFATDVMSHGATVHWLLSVAAGARFKVLYNASLEPEVPHLLGILNKMGANLRGTGTTAISNMGHGGLLSGGSFEIMPDRMEASSYILLAMLLRDRITINGMDSKACRPCLNSISEIVRQSNMKSDPQSFYNTGCGSPACFDFSQLRDFPGQKFVMSPFPGKETDLHQVWAPVLATASSASEIYDPVWTGRKAHLPEMAKFGIESASSLFNSENERSVATKTLHIIVRPSEIKPATDAAGMDLRGTFGLIAAAAKARGSSRIYTPEYALRGYPNLMRNLSNIGISIRQSERGVFLPPLPQLQH